MIRKLVAVIAFALTLIGAEAVQANNLEECRKHDAKKGSVFGTLDFMGEPWIYTWYQTQEWDNARGESVPLIPSKEHTISVPGTDVEFRFEDGTSQRWIGADKKNGGVADNLSTLARGVQENEYYVAKRNDGSVVVVIPREDQFCGAWPVVHPTIFPSGWEDHPLSRCFKGAYRVTDQVAFETNQSLVANFDGELVVLNSNFGLTPDVVVVETFDGFYATKDNGGACSRTYLEEAP